MTDRCAVTGCRGGVDLIYVDRGICDWHWNQLMTDDASRTRLRMGLGLDPTTSPAWEVEMSENETTATAAEGAAEEATVATKTKSTKKAKSERAPKAAAKAKAPKQAKAKREEPKGPKPERTFAIRITSAELAAIHKAAGPRNATKFVRAVAAAFADGDTRAFARVLEEAAQARG